MSSGPMYPSFAAVTLLVLGFLMLLARASQVAFTDRGDGEDAEADGKAGGGEEPGASAGVPATGAARIERHRDTGQSRAERREREILRDEADGEPNEDDGDANPWETDRDAEGRTAERASQNPWDENENPWDDNLAEARARRAGDRDELEFTAGTLLVNVAFSQGVFAAALVAAAWLAEVPPAALGIVTGDPWNAGLPAIGLGAALGAALYVADELAATVADAAGVEHAEGVRESLAPDSLGGWAVLLGVVLPVIAGFEELLFRAALVGAFSTGFGVSPWLLAVLSTVAFAVGHGAQGPGGVAVTGVLGFALAAAFVLTGSLLVVVVAHYVVNALEFAVHEGLGIEWV